ncbi:hypothetical protein H1Q63_16990 [Desmonostoc muscorum CCALA 125]|nr:hypothetical protein [Desmonostoc muscorum CCALA 125]
MSFRETVRAIAHQHNLTASFLPKIFADAAGSGCHIHLSLWYNGQNLLPDPGHLPIEEHQTNGIDLLPQNLGEALEYFKKDTMLLNALNPELSTDFLAVRQAEWEAMKDWELQAEVKLLLEKY